MSGSAMCRDLYLGTVDIRPGAGLVYLDAADLDGRRVSLVFDSSLWRWFAGEAVRVGVEADAGGPGVRPGGHRGR